MTIGSWARRLARKIERRFFLAAKRAIQFARRRAEPGSEKTVVFVCGVQRSGTNMLMDVLERSYATDVYHERDRRAYVDYELRERAVLRELVDRSGAQCVVLKALCEAHELRALLEEFAPAKAIWLVRRYEDVVNSMLKSFPRQDKLVKNIAEDKEREGWPGRGMSEETHELVRSLADESLDRAAAAALIWYFRNVLYFEQSLPGDPRVLLVSYESLTTDPIVELRRLFDFMGLECRSDLSKTLHARSIGRRRAPLIAPAVKKVCDALTSRFSQAMERVR